MELKNRVSEDRNVIKNIVTSDKTWVHGYDPETKTRSSQWKTKLCSRSKKARKDRPNVKLVLIVLFFYFEGIVRLESVTKGQPVNQTFHKEVLIQLKEKFG